MKKNEYYKQLESPEWKAKAEQIKDRDHYTCKICGKQYNLQVHHKKYIKGLKAWEYPDHLLITLCSSCHTKKHGITYLGKNWTHFGTWLTGYADRLRGINIV